MCRADAFLAIATAVMPPCSLSLLNLVGVAMLKFLSNAAIVLLLVFMGLLWKIYQDTPSVAQQMKASGDVLPRQLRTTKILAADGSLLTTQGAFSYKPVRLTDVSPLFVKSLLATEDRRFYNHHGVDPVGIVRAVVSNVFHRRLGEGASTITQQLVRNLFLTNERSMARKLREMVMAMKLESEMTKEQILELYINTIYFGEGAYGIGAASQMYFQKPASQLTLPEAALLAGLPQAPSRLNPYVNPKDALARRHEVVENLLESGLASRDQVANYLPGASFANNLFLASRVSPTKNLAPYFTQWVQDRVQKMMSMDDQAFWQSGMTIHTTISPAAQRAANAAVANTMRQWGRTAPYQQAAALTVEVPTGKILAYVGGKDFEESQFDRVVQAKRSPGSVFKVFTYAAAFQYLDNMTPNTQMVDDDVSFGNWKPQNFDKGHRGPLSLARAFVTSNNVVAVKLLDMAGPSRTAALAKQMGVQSYIPENLAMTLGGANLTVFELTEAVNSIPNQGTRVPLVGIESIEDANKKVLYRHVPSSGTAMSAATAQTMIEMMKGVVLYGTGTGARISGYEVAGKTGTSDDYRDAWFVGFTPSVLTTVWVGNDTNQPMPKISGGTLPTQIWHTLMGNYMASSGGETVFNIPEDRRIPAAVFSSTGKPLEGAQEGTEGETTEGEAPLPGDLPSGTQPGGASGEPGVNGQIPTPADPPLQSDTELILPPEPEPIDRPPVPPSSPTGNAAPPPPGAPYPRPSWENGNDRRYRVGAD